jgi:protein-S-isoprenylcysteine O-methyltransferase Ste14
MNEQQFHFIFTLVGFGMAAGVFIALFFVSAPYGRHVRAGWGPMLPNYLGWMIMEAPSAVLFGVFFLTGSAPKTLTLWVFLAMWEAHYLHRAFIYPFQLRDGNKKMPVSVMVMAFGFNIVNAYVNGRWLFHLSGGYPNNWLAEPRFWVGAVLFVAGYAANRWADLRLRGLRKPGETGYRIPNGGLFRWVSCPNYLGEIVEWVGWAICTWSLPGLAFAVWTAANLAPRARANHAWYHRTFDDYPAERKALIPWIW